MFARPPTTAGGSWQVAFRVFFWWYLRIDPVLKCVCVSEWRQTPGPEIVHQSVSALLRVAQKITSLVMGVACVVKSCVVRSAPAGTLTDLA